MLKSLFNFVIGQVDQFGDDYETDVVASFSSFIDFFIDNELYRIR